MQTIVVLATALALAFPAHNAGAAHHSLPSGAVADSSSSAVSGAITLEARQLQGAEALDVRGTAPANVPVTVTLLALISPDIPTVVVSRHDVVPDSNGRFQAVIPIASAYERGIVLTVVATSAPGITPAKAQLITGAPNAGVSVPLDTDETVHNRY